MLKLCSLLFLLFFYLCTLSPASWSASKCSTESSNWGRTQTEPNPAIWPCLEVVGRRGASSLLRTCMGSARSLKPHHCHQVALGQKDLFKAVGRGRKEKRTPWPLRFWRRRTDWLSGGVLSFTWGSVASASMTANQRDKPCCTGEWVWKCLGKCTLSGVKMSNLIKRMRKDNKWRCIKMEVAVAEQKLHSERDTVILFAAK